jgi:hypothetical protein
VVPTISIRQEERPAWSLPGVEMLIAGIATMAVAGVLLGFGASRGGWSSTGAAILLGLGIALLVVAQFLFRGLVTVTPGEARVVQLFGRYRGTLRSPGLHWVNPLSDRRRISTRVRNHETASAKVNDADGNPIEIAAVVVWQVRDTAEALYGVEDFRTRQLSQEIADRVGPAGVEVVESRLTRLSYASEVAQAMLRVQQATAVVAARQRIVEGAVGMVELALQRHEERDMVDVDEERKAAMVSVQPARGPLQRAGHPAGRQHRIAVPVRPSSSG